MPKAYLYKSRPYNPSQELLCATFDNGTEIITIPHNQAGMFLQHMDNPLIVGDTGTDIRTLSDAATAIETTLEVGQAIKSVWRPGLGFDIETVLDTKIDERAKAKIDLKILVQKLDEILLYIEPNVNSLNSYGHKLRELLILACTEIENSWAEYLKLAGVSVPRPTTNDYVRLCAPLFLSEYEIVFSRHPFKKVFKPFENWNSANPTTSLPWYDAYNLTKHSKNDNFDKATLDNCFFAIAANIVLFCVKYGPYEITAGHDNFSNIINEHFEVGLNNPDLKSFCVPMLKQFTHSEPGNCFTRTWISPPDDWTWEILPFSL